MQLCLTSATNRPANHLDQRQTKRSCCPHRVSISIFGFSRLLVSAWSSIFPRCNKMAEETQIFQHGVVQITNKRAVIDNTTYVLSNVSSVRLVIIKPDRTWGIV